MSTVTPLPGEIVASITRLLPGESVIYWTGSSGWIGSPPYHTLIPWVYAPETQDKYIFVQRKVGESAFGVAQFQYIARRRHESKPA